MKNIVIFTGQTASGKTGLSIEYAKEHNGEIICMDSMQIYEGMPILSACPTEEEKQAAPHHLFEFVSPLENFSVSKYSVLAKQKIEEVIAKGKLPILVGGTGLYMNSLLYMKLIDVPYSDEIREELLTKTNEELYKELNNIDPRSELHLNDKKRIVRAIEIYRLTGRTKTEIDKENRVKSNYTAKIYMKKFEREELYKRINERTKIIFDNAVDEVGHLMKIGVTENHTAGGAIGFKEIKSYLNGEMDYDTCLEKMSQATRNYAKRQETWFKKNEEIIYV